MDGIRIIVDELPDECWDCMLYIMTDFSSYCAVTRGNINPLEHNRLPNCPLEVELEKQPACICALRTVWTDKDDDLVAEEE